MVVYGVVTEEVEEAVELFIRRGDADRFLDEVRRDELELAERLRIEPVESDAWALPFFCAARWARGA